MESKLLFLDTETHGYLRVPLNLLGDERYTDYSFKDKKFAYLEEDYDAMTFLLKHKQVIDESKIKGRTVMLPTILKCING
tara:strand:- start:243 stop:482 length:240 start_codon:yes stop_codon:yes gene_type:complete